MPSPHPRSGQASAEYVAIVAIVAVVLAGVGTAVASPDLRAALARHMQTALCVVGGDICRAADAAAAGLPPCPLIQRTRDHNGGLDILIFRVRGGDVWTVEERSDGSVVYTAANDTGAGLTAGVGLQLAPRLNGDGALSPQVTFTDGATWEFASAAAAAGFLRAMERGGFDPRAKGVPPPTWRYRRGGGELGAALSIGGIPAVSAALAGAVGRRVGRGGTVWYADGEKVGPVLLDGVLDAGRARFGLEVGADRLVLRGQQPGDRPGEVVEAVATLPLRGRMPRSLGELRARLRDEGMIERRVFGTEQESDGTELGIALGIKLAYVNKVDMTTRRLRSATVRLPGDAGSRRRIDCRTEAL